MMIWVLDKKRPLCYAGLSKKGRTRAGTKQKGMSLLSKQAAQLQSENTKANFSKGWGIVIYCMAMFFLLIGYSIDGLNVVAPAFSEATGVDYSAVLSMSAVAGFIGIIAYIVIGRICVKVGARWVSGVCLIGSGIFYFLWGHATTLLTYTVTMTGVVVFINGAAYIAGGALVAQWFPKKKGLVNGFTTMGHNAGSAFYVPLITVLIGTLGFKMGMSLASIFAIVLGVIGLFCIRDTPQERNMLPDNVTPEVYAREYSSVDSIEDQDCGWTVKKLLKTKELWLCAIITGLNQLVTTGVMSQLVVRNSEFYPVEFCVTMMTVCALVGIAGSYVFGWLDQKFGIKFSIRTYLIWYIAALLINITNTKAGILISIPMIGVAIGAAANYIISLPSSIFGRHGFNKVYSVDFPIMQILLMSNYIINSVALKLTGSLRGSYMLFCVLLAINFVLISVLDVRKYNWDYMTEEQIAKLDEGK